MFWGLKLMILITQSVRGSCYSLVAVTINIAHPRNVHRRTISTVIRFNEWFLWLIIFRTRARNIIIYCYRRRGRNDSCSISLPPVVYSIMQYAYYYYYYTRAHLMRRVLEFKLLMCTAVAASAAYLRISTG